MITNDVEYATTKRKIKEMTEALQQHKKRNRPDVFKGVEEAMVAGIQDMIDDMIAECDVYIRNNNG